MEDDPGRYSLLFMGNTCAFRAAFEKAGVDGGYITSSDGAREYVRCLRGLQLDDAGRERVLGVLGGDVLRGHAVFLFDETDAPDDPM
eukprot:8325405-Alexandrium_andersonii.AAC.1